MKKMAAMVMAVMTVMVMVAFSAPLPAVNPNPDKAFSGEVMCLMKGGKLVSNNTVCIFPSPLAGSLKRA